MKCPSPVTRFLNTPLCLVVCLAALCSPIGTQANDSVQIDSMDIGFDGQILLGHWVPVHIELSGDVATADSFELGTLDGDAVPTSFVFPFQGDATGDDSLSAAGYIRIGRAGGVSINVLDSQGQVLGTRSWSRSQLEETHQFQPSTTRLTLVLGWQTDEGPDQLQTLFGTDAVAVLNDFAKLPRHPMGYNSVDWLVIDANETIDPQSFSPAMIGSIDRWVRSGGRLLISSGAAADRFLAADSPLASLTDARLISTQQTRDSGPLELLVGSTDQLVSSTSDALTYSAFGAPEQYVGAELQNEPLLIQQPWGLGRVSVIGLDLNSEPIRSWKSRSRLVSRALMNRATTDSAGTASRSGRVSHNGYDDLSGQLRVSLDQFSNVSFVTFTTVAVLIALFILAIGAGDYFFLRKFVRRMEWTWLTFLLITCIFMGIIFWIAGISKSGSIEVNQVEVIDLDVQSGAIRGTVLAHFYSPQTATYDIALPKDNDLVGTFDETWISWNGLPGTGMGGMQSRSDMGLYRRSYQVSLTVDPSTTEATSVESNLDGSTMNNVPLQTAATKALAGRWWARVEGLPVGNLKQNANTDAVNGTFTNPFQVRLDNCVLFYDDWAYVLNSSLDPGETIDVESETREKTINGYFTRRKVEGKSDITTPWSPTDTSISRIMDVMMFFEAAGGSVYTTLTNDYQDHLDMSDQLRLGNAVLLGQIRDVTTPLLFDGESASDRYDKKITFVRAVFPVQPRESRGNR